MIILKQYFLSEIEREKIESELFLLKPQSDREEILSLDDKEIVEFYQKQKETVEKSGFCMHPIN